MPQPALGITTKRIGSADVKRTVKTTSFNHRYVFGLSAVAALGGYLFGFDSGVINGAVDAISAVFGTKAAATGFAVASVLLGCAFGADALANLIGRRPTILFNAVLFVVSAFATGTPGSAGMFIDWRIVGGLAIGAAVCLPQCISLKWLRPVCAALASFRNSGRLGSRAKC